MCWRVMQQEDISLREIIEVVLRGKTVIAVVTLLSILLGGILGFVVMTPIYKVNSTVRIDEVDKRPLLSSLTQSLKSDAVIALLIEGLDLDKNKYSVEKIKQSIKLEVHKDTLIMSVSVEGSEPATIKNIANALAIEAGRRIEITERSKKIIEAQNAIIDLERNISITEKTLQETMDLLAQTPEKLVVNQSLANNSELYNIIKEQTNGNSKIGSIIFESEEINPVYYTLLETKAQLGIQLARLQAELQNQQMLVETNQEKIFELENNFDLSNINRAERILSEYTIVFISTAIEPDEPVKPNKLMIVAVFAVLGIILSLIIVFFRHYWSYENTKVDTPFTA